MSDMLVRIPSWKTGEDRCSLQEGSILGEDNAAGQRHNYAASLGEGAILEEDQSVRPMSSMP